MFDAVNKWRGESPDSANIERVSAEARAEARRDELSAAEAGVWKDPFAEDPDKPIPVRMNASKQRELVMARREVARARAEAASAQADAARARADAAKVKANAAHTEAVAARADAMAAKHEAEAARNACGGALDPVRHAAAPRLPAVATDSQADLESVAAPKRSRSRRASRTSKASFARSSRASASASASAAGPAPSVVAEEKPPAPPPELPPTPPVAFANSSTGIIVVPITR